jgi:hypothetical protein
MFVAAPPLAPVPYVAEPMMAMPPPPPQPIIEDLSDEEIVEYGDWWQYSRFALPWLLFCLILLSALFALTFWQQAGNIKNYFDGVPRILQRVVIQEDKDEAGLPENVRNLRIAYIFAGFFAVAGAILTFFLRPRPSIRKALGFIFALLLIATAILAWIAFGVALAHFHETEECIENHLLTFEPCLEKDGIAITAIAIDSGVGLLAIVAAIQLAYNCVKGHWRMAPRDPYQEQRDREFEVAKARIPGEMIQRNVSFVRKWLTGLNLFALTIVLAAAVVFIILISEYREIEYVRNGRGRAYRDLRFDSTEPFEHAGWPTNNYRIRYGATGLGLLTLLLNFLPFRSKTVAFIFATLYFFDSVILMIAFGFDVHELRRTAEFECPNTVLGEEMDCFKSPFIATAVLDFMCSLALVIYLIVEYMILSRRAAKP